MARRLTLELPDELEQKLVDQAEQLNISLEDFVMKSLKQEFYQPRVSIEQLLSTYLLISEMLTRLRDARIAGQINAVVSADPVTLHLAIVGKEGGLIQSYEFLEGTEQPQLLIRLNPQAGWDEHTRLKESAFDWDESIFPPELHPVLENLKSEDPELRVKALVALGDFCSDSQR